MRSPAPASDKTSAGPPGPRHALLLLALAAITFGVYARTLSFPFINWDDPNYVIQNQDIRDFSPPHLKNMFSRAYAGVYVPLTMLSFAIDYQLYHFNAAGFRATNLVLHILSVILLYLIALRMTGDGLLAFGIALIFAVHPVQTESVIWISQRKNVLSFFLYLAAFLAYACADPGPRERFLKILTFAFFVLACLAKSLSLTLPAVLLLYDHLFRRPGKKQFPFYLFLFLVSLLFVWLSFRFTVAADPANALGPPHAPDAFTAVRTIMKYVTLTFFPLHQSIRYPFPAAGTLMNPACLTAAAGVLALAGLLVFLYRRDRILFFWGVWPLVLLAPTLSFIAQRDFVQDRWLYLPLAGFWMLVLSPLKRYAGKTLYLMVLFTAALAFGVLNVRRQAVWSDPETLWLETRKVTGEIWSSTYYNLAMYYEKEGRYDDALEQYRKAAEDFQLPNAYRGMGNIHARRGNFQQAAFNYQKAMELEPPSATLHNSVGFLFTQAGQMGKALEEFDKAAVLDPHRPEIQINRARALALLGRPAEAEEAFQKALALDPDLPDTLINYAGFLLTQERLEEAEEVCLRFLKLHAGLPAAGNVRKMLAEIETRKKP